MSVTCADDFGMRPCKPKRPASVSISGMTITGGDPTGGGTSKEIDMGGGVYNTGTLTLDRVAVIGNHADGGGGVFSVPGSYITTSNSLTIRI